MGYGRVWPIWQGTDSVDTKKYGLREFMGYHRYGLRQRRLYKECNSTILIIYERAVLGSPRIKPDVLMPSVYMTSPPLKGSQSAW